VGRRGTILRIAVIVLAVVAVGYSVRSFWATVRHPSGSEKDAIILVCARCDQESVLPSAEYKKLPRDPATGSVQCPKCGEKAARVASVRCPKCHRAIPPQPPNAPMVCPFCKAPLIEDEDAERAPPRTGQ
jgi:hypothetical protein